MIELPHPLQTKVEILVSFRGPPFRGSDGIRFRRLTYAVRSPLKKTPKSTLSRRCPIARMFNSHPLSIILTSFAALLNLLVFCPSAPDAGLDAQVGLLAPAAASLAPARQSANRSLCRRRLRVSWSGRATRGDILVTSGCVVALTEGRR